MRRLHDAVLDEAVSMFGREIGWRDLNTGVSEDALPSRVDWNDLGHLGQPSERQSGDFRSHATPIEFVGEQDREAHFLPTPRDVIASAIVNAR
jgi:hypothetical protein